MNAGSVPGPDPQYTQIVRIVLIGRMCLSPWCASRHRKLVYGATENTAGAIEFPRFFPCIAGIAGKVDHERAMDSAMTRAGVTYVAMAAAGISAAVLGYGVIWSYGEPEAPPVAMSAPPAPEPQNPIPPMASAPSDATAQPRTEALPNPVAAAPPPPPSAPPTTTPVSRRDRVGTRYPRRCSLRSRSLLAKPLLRPACRVPRTLRRLTGRSKNLRPQPHRRTRRPLRLSRERLRRQRRNHRPP